MIISKEEREKAIQESHFKGCGDFESGLLDSFDNGWIEGKVEDAKGMKAENIPIETIARITDLKIKQIETVLNKGE